VRYAQIASTTQRCSNRFLYQLPKQWLLTPTIAFCAGVYDKDSWPVNQSAQSLNEVFATVLVPRLAENHISVLRRLLPKRALILNRVNQVNRARNRNALREDSVKIPANETSRRTFHRTGWPDELFAVGRFKYENHSIVVRRKLRKRIKLSVLTAHKMLPLDIDWYFHHLSF
jgi:hypothetical protein